MKHVGGSAPALVPLLLWGALLLPLGFHGDGHDTKAHANGLATISPDELDQHLVELASPELEGRDSPSQGLERAAQYIAGTFASAGLAPPPDANEAPITPGTPGTETETETEEAKRARELKAFLRPFTRNLPRPRPDGCSLVLTVGDAPPQHFTFGKDFVPLAGCNGSAEGEVVFLGYGIDSPAEKYDEVPNRGVEGKIALILEGEPRDDKKFEGIEVSADASLWEKVDDLAQERLAGVLIARRPPQQHATSGATMKGWKGAAPEPARLSFRHTFADWVDAGRGRGARSEPPANALPALEITLETASAILGEDVVALAATIDKRVRPVKVDGEGRQVTLASATEEASVPIDNVVGYIAGSDLAGEFVVVGAHYDHVGVDERGRIGCGADDNASGTASMIEVAQALAAAHPRRSILAVAFGAEEDGLLGSKAFCDDPPVRREAIVAMINMDMLGRGEADEVAVLGIIQNPGFEEVLEDARKLSRTGVKTIVMRQGEELFQRSDHYSFHQAGIPALFFFEGLPISKNADYHTWRDTLERLDRGKILNSTKLVFNTAWLLANADERPPKPRD